MSHITETTLFFDSTKGSGRSHNFIIDYNPPLSLDQKKRYEIGLVSADVWHSWYNIHTNNNVFAYFNGLVWKKIILTPGAYNITDIDREIKRMIDANGDTAKNIMITPNYNTLKCRMVIVGLYQVDFTVTNSIRSVLGFNSQVLSKAGTFSGEKNVNISDINSLIIGCSIVNDSYVNGSSSDCIFTFSPNVPPGALIAVRPSQILYLPVVQSYTVQQITMRITDQSGNEVDLNGERVTYYLHLRQSK